MDKYDAKYDFLEMRLVFKIHVNYLSLKPPIYIDNIFIQWTNSMR